MKILRRNILFVAAILLLSLTACSSVPETDTMRGGRHATYAAPSNNDPLEPVNRVVFDVNDFLDRLLLKPLAGLYRVMVPPPLRTRVAYILSNMSEPVIFANNLLQAEFTKAGTTFARFMTNTTLGVGGIFEVANEYGLYRQRGDFGQTLYTWGLGSGPYIVLPLFGPSTLRDAVGLGVDMVMSPWQYIVTFGDTSIEDSFAISSMTATALAQRESHIEDYDALREGSLDFYAQMRSVYRQHRSKQLGEPLTSSMPSYDDMEDE